MLTGDEEVAHAFSHGEAGKLVEQYASGCEAAFNLESGYTSGEVTTRRNGGAIIRAVSYTHLTISIKDNIFFFILFLPFSDRFYPD